MRAGEHYAGRKSGLGPKANVFAFGGNATLLSNNEVSVNEASVPRGSPDGELYL